MLIIDKCSVNWFSSSQISMTIDIACHWLHLHTSLLQVRKSRIWKLNLELSINLSIFRVQPVTSLLILLATTGCASTILIGTNTFDSFLPTAANYQTERCSSPCAPAMSSSTPGMWIITSQCIFNLTRYILSLYLAHFTSGPLYLFYIMAVITFPVAVAKSGIALLQVDSFL